MKLKLKKAMHWKSVIVGTIIMIFAAISQGPEAYYIPFGFFMSIWFYEYLNWRLNKKPWNGKIN